jgi:hypothetical protein
MYIICLDQWGQHLAVARLSNYHILCLFRRIKHRNLCSTKSPFIHDRGKAPLSSSAHRTRQHSYTSKHTNCSNYRKYFCSSLLYPTVLPVCSWGLCHQSSSALTPLCSSFCNNKPTIRCFVTQDQLLVSFVGLEYMSVSN